jgi:hypothetical protein
MDFSKLSQNEKLALYGSIAVIVGAAGGGTVSGLGWLALLAAIGMVAVVLLPAFSPTTTLPGSKGSLMVILGGIAGVIMLLALLVGLQYIGVVFGFAPISAILFLIAVAGGLVMAWAGWQEFQAEGGKVQIGTAPSGSTPAATPPPPSGPAEPAPPPAAAPPAPTSPAEPMPPREPITPPPAAGTPPPATGTPPAGTPPPMGSTEDDDRA